MGSEETGLCIRLKRKRPDVKIIYDPSAIVYHRVPKERAKMFYALRRAFYERYSKALIKDLTTERDYLKFLAKSMLSKIGRLKFIWHSTYNLNRSCRIFYMENLMNLYLKNII